MFNFWRRKLIHQKNHKQNFANNAQKVHKNSQKKNFEEKFAKKSQINFSEISKINFWFELEFFGYQTS